MANPFMAGPAISQTIGGILGDVGAGVDGFFRTRRMIDDDLERKRMRALQERQINQQMELARNQEGRAQQTFDRNLLKEKTAMIQAQGQHAIRSGQVGAAKNLMGEYLDRYNQLNDTNRVGARFHERPVTEQGPDGSMVALNPDMTPAKTEFDDRNPFNVKALAEIYGLAAPQPTILQTGGGGLISVQPSYIGGEQPTITTLRESQKTLAPKDRFQVVGNSLIDLLSGKVVFHDPSGGGSGSVLNAARITLMEAQMRNMDADNKRADAAELQRRQSERQNAYLKVYNEAIAAGYDAAEAGRQAKSVIGVIDTMFGTQAPGAAPTQPQKPKVRGATPRAQNLAGPATTPGPTPKPSPRGGSDRARALAGK